MRHGFVDGCGTLYFEKVRKSHYFRSLSRCIKSLRFTVQRHSKVCYVQTCLFDFAFIIGESFTVKKIMPLGIDRTHFYAEKVKRQEKDIRVSVFILVILSWYSLTKFYTNSLVNRVFVSYMYFHCCLRTCTFWELLILRVLIIYQSKDERIAQLETENSMLYLKLAQLHGAVQTARHERSVLSEQVEAESSFRQDVSDRASVLQRELEVI